MARLFLVNCTFYIKLVSNIQENLLYNSCIYLNNFFTSCFQADGKTPTPPESPPSYTDLEETAKQERLRLEELLKSKGMKYGSYPRFIVAVKGQKVSASTFTKNVLYICLCMIYWYILQILKFDNGVEIHLGTF